MILTHAKKKPLQQFIVQRAGRHIPFCVFKVTGLARFQFAWKKASVGVKLNESETSEFEKVKKRVNSICKSAFEAKIPIFIDAEESWIQQAIDDLANSMMLAIQS